MIGVVQIPQENIESVWALVDDAITKALAYSGHHYNTQDVLEDLTQRLQTYLFVLENKENFGKTDCTILRNGLKITSVRTLKLMPDLDGLNY
jgi:hypothetical protein